MEASTFYATFAGLAAMTGIICSLIIKAVGKMMDMGRAWVITLPGSPGALARIERRHLKEGKFRRKKGDEEETFIAAGLAAYPTKKGPLHLLTDFGANLVAPSKDEIYKNLLAAETEKAKEKYFEALREAGKDPSKDKDPELWAKLLEEAKRTPMRFLVHDPLIYYRAEKENDTEDYYAAQQQKKHWMESVAPFLAICVVALVGLVGFMLWKVLPLITEKGG